MEREGGHEGVAVKTTETSRVEVLLVKLEIQSAAFWAELGSDANELRVVPIPVERGFELRVGLGREPWPGQGERRRGFSSNHLDRLNERTIV